ncbi:MAG: hypothetical protein ABIH04_01980 [Planctomycetota bacterium]
MFIKQAKQYWWVVVLAGLAVWAGILAYSTFFPPKTPYQEKVEAIAELLGGVKADDLSEAREILEEVNSLIREPAKDQRLYLEIKLWLEGMKHGEPSEEDRKKIREDREKVDRVLYGEDSPIWKELTWADIEKDALHNAQVLLELPPAAELRNLKDAAKALEKRMAEIQEENISEFNRDLDRFRDALKNPDAVQDKSALLAEINRFLTEEAPERAKRCPLLSETIVVPFLVEMLDDEKPTKRSRLYEVIVRIVALARSEDITADEPSDEAVREVKTKILPYDPNAPSGERKAAMQRMREWLNSGENKGVYNP